MSSLSNALIAAVGQIVESMYFRQAVYSGPSTLDASVISASVSFSGPLTGKFRVALTSRLARELTADFLVAEPSEILPSEVISTTRELANIACGTVLSAWLPSAAFDFETPQDLETGHTPDCFAHTFALSCGDPDMGVDIRIGS